MTSVSWIEFLWSSVQTLMLYREVNPLFLLFVSRFSMDCNIVYIDFYDMQLRLPVSYIVHWTELEHKQANHLVQCPN